jgi:hypothetical protein
MGRAITASSILLCLCLQCTPSAKGGPVPVAASAPSGWLDEVQTYCMVPVLPDTAAALHVTVNGVWGGMGGTDPILTHRDTVPAVQKKYDTDARAFVDACHGAGLIVPGVVNGLEGFATMRETWPNLESMACRNAEGKPVEVGNDKMLLMCTNNPDWQQWEVDCGKRCIDAGADLITVDTPMSASFISGFLKAGFCRYCMANFERYLEHKFTPEERQKRFGLAEFDAAAVAARLSPLQDLGNPKSRPFHNTTQDDLLFREFIYCQEQASFDTRKALVDALRVYAKQKGREVAFATNASDLGTANPGGHWIRALMFADIFDLFVYEQNVEPNGMPSDDVTKYPRGKWAAYHKLAYAIHHRRSAAVIHASAMGRILQQVLTKGKTTNTWMEVQSAEAYAANGAYIQYYVEPRAGWRLLFDKCWAGSAEHAAFVESHRDLYAGELRSGSPLAVLFLYNERGRAIPAVDPSYLGFAQALVEGNYPFDVLFAGDGHYVQDRLKGEALQPYRAVLIPSPVRPTANQKQVIGRFVRAGGTVVCEEPDALGLSGKRMSTPGPGAPSCLAGQFPYGKGRVLVLRGEVSDTSTDDVGSAFFRTYEPEPRRMIARLAEALGLASMVPGDESGLVSAFPVLQPERQRLIVHLVNCDIDYDKDRIRERTDVPLSLARPAFLRGTVAALLYWPGQEPEALPVLASGERLTFTVPHLGVTATVVIAEQTSP